MSELGFRILILITGISLIAAIYFWGRLKNKSKNERRRVVSIEDQHATDFSISAKDEVIPDLTETIQDLHDETQRLKAKDDADVPFVSVSREHHAPVNNNGQDSADTSSTNTQDFATDNKPAQQSQHLVLIVKAEDDTEFSGLDILTNSKAVGMKFSDTGVFHYYADAQAKKGPLFSMANLYEPGEFDLITLDKLTTQGLLFFMPLPCTTEANTAVQTFYATACKFADNLDGEVLSQDKQIVTQELLDYFVGQVSACH